jgi:hypothetical protein
MVPSNPAHVFFQRQEWGRTKVPLPPSDHFEHSDGESAKLFHGTSEQHVQDPRKSKKNVGCLRAVQAIFRMTSFELVTHDGKVIYLNAGDNSAGRIPCTWLRLTETWLLYSNSLRRKG